MKKKFLVLGINIGLHDSSAALLADGKLIVMAEQERFSRIKNASGEAPVDAIKYCLDFGKITLEELDAIALGTDMKLLDEWHEHNEIEIKERVKLDAPTRLFPKNIFNYSTLPPIIPIKHHIAHAASAFRVSGYKDAAILVIDNRGEDSSTTIAYGNDKSINELESFGVPVSLGLYYRTAAMFTGLYGKNREVGKFMGLASYGVANQCVPLYFNEQPLYKDIENVPENLRGIEVPPYRTSQLLNYFKENCYPFTPGIKEDVMSYANFAASIQNSLEQTILGLCKKLKDITNSKNLVIAGGVALNCTANKAIVESGIFENVYIQPVAHDAGVALGAALEVSKEYTGNFKMNHAYWGPQYSQEEINFILDNKYKNINYVVLEEDALVDQVSSLIVNGKTVGWFQGRAEVGPRALGARSILGNPQSRETLVKLNKLKSREMWRPLAPAIMDSEFKNYFTSPHDSPFMIVASKVLNEKQNLIPAVVHIDGSARPQSVSKSTNLKFWKLLNKFKEQTGIPILVNTSFNVQNEPIVNTPENAIDDFLSTELDVLVIENALILK